MTPIESPYDVRFLTLVDVAISALEELALVTDSEPSQLLAEYLYKSNKQIHELGEQPIANKLMNSYPLLNEAIV